MHKPGLWILVTVLTLAAIACSLSGAGSEAAPQPSATTMDVQATVDSQVEATVSAMTTATMAAAEALLDELEEEALSEEIDAAAQQVTQSTTQAADAATQAAGDGEITQEEAEQIVYYISDAEAAIAYTEYLIESYYGVYAELAEETLELLYLIEDDLAATEAVLDELLGLAQQGAQTTAEVLSQIEAAAEQAGQLAENIGQHSGDWQGQVAGMLQDRADQALSVQPDQLADNLPETIQSVRDYLETVRGALGDNVLSAAELGSIAQLGANASANLQTHGGPKLNGLAGQIDGLTGQVARGQFGQARQGLGGLEAQLPSISR